MLAQYSRQSPCSQAAHMVVVVVGTSTSMVTFGKPADACVCTAAGTIGTEPETEGKWLWKACGESADERLRHVTCLIGVFRQLVNVLQHPCSLEDGYSQMVEYHHGVRCLVERHTSHYSTHYCYTSLTLPSSFLVN